MTRREFNKMLYPNTFNEKGLPKNDNARFSKNIAIDANASSSLLYSHNSKYIIQWLAKVQAKQGSNGLQFSAQGKLILYHWQLTS